MAAFNAIDNRLPYRGVDADVILADFRCADAVGSLAGLPGTPSPSRALSDLFWMRAPWARMERELGPLRIFDLGCGSGEYGIKFSEWSGGRVTRYFGVDLQPHPRWAELTRSYAFMDFREGDVERLGEIVPPDTNVIVSQSTLEHVQDDVRCVAQLDEFARRAGHRLWQIHLVPSQACLHLYLWHGYRQYTPRTLSETTRPLAASERWVVRLGGAACNRLHWKFVTWPLLIGGGRLAREAFSRIPRCARGRHHPGHGVAAAIAFLRCHRRRPTRCRRVRRRLLASRMALKVLSVRLVAAGGGYSGTSALTTLPTARHDVSPGESMPAAWTTRGILACRAGS